jgi:hypothetical protein
MESLLQLLPEMIRLAGDQDEVREQACFVAWKVTAGSQLSQTCRPFRLYRKTLVIAVLDETWKKQLESMSRVYVFKLNALLGQTTVTFIEFRVDADHVRAGRTQEAEREVTTVEPQPDLRVAAAGIKDESLRELFLRVATRSIKSREE